MNSQLYNKDELYPEDFTEEDKLEFDLLLEQAKALFPKMANDTWVLKLGITAYLKKFKKGIDEPISQEEIAKIKGQYTTETVFYTEPFDYSSSNIEISSNIPI